MYNYYLFIANKYFLSSSQRQLPLFNTSYSMTDKDKIEKLETISLLRLNIGLCFDNQENTFSSENYAKDLLIIAFDEGVTLTEWVELICGYLYRCSEDPHFIVEQTNMASVLYQTTEV
jgi:hypothetical protein